MKMNARCVVMRADIGTDGPRLSAIPSECRSMHFADDHGTYAATIGDLKSALDPNRILAPGRYEPTGVPCPQTQPS